MAHHGAELIEWYRVDPTPRLWRFVWRAGGLMLAGTFLSATWFVADAGTVVRAVVGGVGILCVIGSGLLAFGWLSYSLSRDEYIAARLDAVVVHLPGCRRVIPWDDLLGVSEAQAHLVLELARGERLVIRERFAGIDAKTLASHLDDYRRKAAFRLLERVLDRE